MSRASLAFVLVLVLVLTLGARARAEPITLPSYPGAPLTRIGNELTIDGELYRISYFVTKDSVDDVAKYFHHEFHHQGIPCTVDGDMKSGAVVSGFYTRDGVQRAVVLRKHGDKTVGFSVIHDLWVTAKPTAPPTPLKLEGTLFSAEVGARNEDAAQSQSTLVERNLAQVRGDVLKQMEHAGYQSIRETASRVDGTQHLVFEHARGAQHVLTTLAQVEANLTAVLQTTVGKGAP